MTAAAPGPREELALLIRGAIDSKKIDEAVERLIALSALVTKETLRQYMRDWDARATAAGATGEWELSDVVNVDADGVLLCWEWWKVVGTDMEGAAVIKTTDEGVLSERIVYRR